MITVINVLLALAIFEDAVASNDIGGYSSHGSNYVIYLYYQYKLKDIKFPRN